jgi:SAM-dependent methyltransferase
MTGNVRKPNITVRSALAVNLTPTIRSAFLPMPLPLQIMPAVSPMRRLLDAEARALAPELGGLAGAHGLQVAAAALRLPPTPLLGRWAQLQLDDATGLGGDVRARADEALPFLDDVFRVVLLAHALEHAPCAAELLAEAARVLAPEGLLMVTGFHPLSAWTPWLVCRGRQRPQLAGPAWLRARLAAQGVQTYAVRRFGPAVPGVSASAAQAWLGGGFLLLARKRRAAVTPLRDRARSGRVAVGTFAPGARRECA